MESILRNPLISNQPIGKFELGYMMGHSTKNLIKRANYGTKLVDFSYELDTNGKITKVVIDDPSFGKQVRTFNYDCE